MHYIEDKNIKKANLVSVNVDRLVCDGYIIRKEIKGDRRKTQLICTPAAEEILKMDLL